MVFGDVYCEFVVSKRAISGVFNTLEKRVLHLFDAFLSRACDEDIEIEGSQDQLWLKLEGNPDSRQRAKEYIIAVCQPAAKKQVLVPTGFHKDRLWKMIDELEKRFCASLILDIKEQNVDVRGATIAVALAASALEQSLVEGDSSGVGLKSGDQTETRDKSIDPGTNTNASENKNTTNIAKSGEEQLRSDGRAVECAESGKDHVQGEEMPAKCIGDSNKEAVEPNKEDKEAFGDTNTKESIRDFALKLGYPRTDIDGALGKLGHLADKNSLLDELLKRSASAKQLEDGLCAAPSSEKVILPVEDADCLRSIAIDGSNVAMSHGNQKVFSCRGIGIAVDYFLRRGHKEIKVFLPLSRKENRPDKPMTDAEVLARLEEDGFLVWTPAREINGRMVACYDDRFIIEAASKTDGVIVSNDMFRDLLNENAEWKKCIEQRLLMYSFVNDLFMPPDDPLGRHGPVLKDFLRKGCGKLCPYGPERCTYGNRCKFLHPERNTKTEEEARGATAAPRKEKGLPDVPYGSIRRSHRPMPPTPDKPLPFPPQFEMHSYLNAMFPPTRRDCQGRASRLVVSDPARYDLPPDVLQVHEQFQRSSSLPCFESRPPGGAVVRGPARRVEQPSSISHIPDGFPGCPSHIPAYSASPTRSDVVPRGMRVAPPPPGADTWLPGDAYRQASYVQYPPHYAPVAGGQWGPYPQQQYPPCAPPSPQYQYPPPGGNMPPYYAGRTPYRGQRSGYFRSRAPPIIGGEDESDSPGEASDTALRIRAYDKLLEIFPDDGEKILRVMDDHPDATSVEELTQYIIEEESS